MGVGGRCRVRGRIGSTLRLVGRGRSDDERLQLWIDDFHLLAQLVYTVFMRREIFEELDDALVRNGGAHTSILCDSFLRPMYAESQATLLRRLGDNDPDSRSFRRLLLDMQAHSHLLTRERYVGFYLRDDGEGADSLEERMWLQRAHDAFDRMAGTGEAHIPAERLAEHLAALDADLRTVKRFVDRRVAHFDRRSGDMTWGDLNAAMESIEKHLEVIGSILTASTHLARPAIQGDWKAPLRVPVFRRSPESLGWIALNRPPSFS